MFIRPDLDLTLGSATGTDGTRLTQQPCMGATTQVFRLTQVG